MLMKEAPHAKENPEDQQKMLGPIGLFDARRRIAACEWSCLLERRNLTKSNCMTLHYQAGQA
jgi:hypothetical protein